MSTFKDIVILDTILAPELFYMPGDVTTIQFNGAGYITTGGTSIRTFMSFDKLVHSSVQSFTVDEQNTTIRQDGKYIFGNSNQNASWNGTITLVRRGCTFILNFTAPSALFNCINNAPVGILSNLTIHFN